MSTIASWPHGRLTTRQALSFLNLSARGTNGDSSPISAGGAHPAASTYVRFLTCATAPLSEIFCSNQASGCLTHIRSTHAASLELTLKTAAGIGVIR